MTRRARTRRFVTPLFLFALAFLLPALVSGQSTTTVPDQGPPGQPGKPLIVGDEPWFDAGPGWVPLDPRALPGRDGGDEDSRFTHWSSGPRFTGCLVKADYEPPVDAGIRDNRVSVLVGCTLPQTRARKATGYEITVDQSSAMRILRLDADGTSTVLAESPVAPASMVGGRNYIITVERSGTRLKAKIQTKGDPDPGWQVNADDATYAQGQVGVASSGARGRIFSLVATEITPVVIDASPPGTPGKPEF